MTGAAAAQCVPISDAETAPAARQGLSGVYFMPKALDVIDAEWRDLARNAVEENPFYAPWMLRPALAHISAANVKVACVFDGGRLIGLAPLAPMKGYARLPVRYLATWMHEHCFYAAPLVRRGCEDEFFKALFRMADNNPARPAFLRLRHIDADGPLAAAARRAAEASGRLSCRSGAYNRALLKCGYRAEVYLATTVRKKKRKEMNRLRRRLEETGAVVMETLEDARDLGPWRDEFLHLESVGWKGRAGSALAASQAGVRFFSEMLDGAVAAKTLRFYRLKAGARTIAMIVNFIAGEAGYSFKIAHDPDFARFSPGVMLELEMIKALEGEQGLCFVDSCASADHPMINALWADRRAIVGLNISGRRPRDRAILSACAALESARARLATLGAS